MTETPVSKKILPSLLAVGAVFIGLIILRAMIPPFRTALEQRDWVKTQCAMELSEVRGTSPGLEPAVRYRYTFEGQERVGSTFEHRTTISRSDQDLRRMIDRYPAGSTAPCWVSPRDPSDVVLTTQSLGVGLMFLIPGGFLAGGALALKVMWLPGRPRARRHALDDEHSEDEEKQTAGVWPLVGILLFFGLFMAAGAGLTYLFFVGPYLSVRETFTWNEQRCTVLTSGVRSISGSKNSSNSYQIETTYEYTVGGKRYIGDTYGPAERAGSDAEAKQAAVERIPMGAEVPCFVDPSDPFRSTLVREIPAGLWQGLFPMIFFCAGLGGLLYATGNLSSVPRRKQGPNVSRKAQSRLRAFAVLVLFTLVWNGITGAVGFGLLHEWRHGTMSIFPLLIVAPFALLGALMVVSVPYSFLQLFNPTVDLEFSEPEPRPGTTFVVSWRLNGRADRVTKLEVTMDIIRRRAGGRDQTTDSTMHTATVFTTDRAAAMERGTIQVAIPAFEDSPGPESGESRFVKFSVKLSIPQYPDSLETVELPLWAEEPPDE